MDRIKAVYDISGKAWKFYKTWSEKYEPKETLKIWYCN